MYGYDGIDRCGVVIRSISFGKHTDTHTRASTTASTSAALKSAANADDTQTAVMYVFCARFRRV